MRGMTFAILAGVMLYAARHPDPMAGTVLTPEAYKYLFALCAGVAVACGCVGK